MDKEGVMNNSSILMIGAGNIDIDIVESEYPSCFVVCVDTKYDNGTNIFSIEEEFLKWKDAGVQHSSTSIIYHVTRLKIVEFLKLWKYKFDHIVAERVFEHMFYDTGEIGQLLYKCAAATTHDATMSIVVPNFDKVCVFLDNLEDLEVKMSPADYARNVLVLNTEICNTRTDPHGSIWNSSLANYYIDSDGNWKIDFMDESYEHEGREVYLDILLRKRKVG